MDRQTSKSGVKIALCSLDPLASLPLAPKGLRLDGFVEMFSMLASTHHEHDPENNFVRNLGLMSTLYRALTNIPDRMGTHVLPEYQRRGLGSWLTRYCNSITDDHQAKT